MSALLPVLPRLFRLNINPSRLFRLLIALLVHPPVLPPHIFNLGLWVPLLRQSQLKYQTSHNILGNFILTARGVGINHLQTRFLNGLLQGWV